MGRDQISWAALRDAACIVTRSGRTERAEELVEELHKRYSDAEWGRFEKQAP